MRAQAWEKNSTTEQRRTKRIKGKKEKKEKRRICINRCRGGEQAQGKRQHNTQEQDKRARQHEREREKRVFEWGATADERERVSARVGG